MYGMKGAFLGLFGILVGNVCPFLLFSRSKYDSGNVLKPFDTSKPGAFFAGSFTDHLVSAEGTTLLSY